MNRLKFVRGAVAALVALGLVFPQFSVIAAGPKTDAKPTVRTVAANSVLDIGLTQGGTFTGRVVDQTGTGLEGAEVVITQGKTEVTRTVTDKQGTFFATNLKGGVFTVASGKTVGTYRLWSEKTAPPSAHEQVLIVKGQNGVRGQVGATRGEVGGGARTTVIVGALIVGAAVGGYYIGEAAGSPPSGAPLGNTSILPVSP